MLGIEELLELEDALKEELDDNLTAILARLNRKGELQTLLHLLDLDHLLEAESGYEVYKTGKIIVIGQSEVKAEALLAIAKTLGIDKNRFELYLDYNDAKKFDFKRIQWQPSYSAIMVGPMPHSGTSKGTSGSVISAIECADGYPPVIRLGSNSLKITKSSFRDSLEEMIQTNKIA